MKEKEYMRLESDSIGTMEVPEDAYYGVQALRAKENFPITGTKLHPVFIKNLAKIKRAAAITNRKAGRLKPEIANAIEASANEVICGMFDKDFIVDGIQGGAGTSANMNMNEVIANRAIEMLCGKKGDYTIVHPNDHVNMAQSTNDVIPTAGKLTVLDLLKPLDKSLSLLTEALYDKAEEFDPIVKIGRTQLEDAVPMRLGQTFHSYATMISRDRDRLTKVRTEMYPVNMGSTAIGTAINTSPFYLDNIVPTLGKITGYPLTQADDLFDATENLDGFVRVSSCLKACAVNLSKMCNDLRILASGPKAGFGEITLPAHHKIIFAQGSSRCRNIHNTLRHSRNRCQFNIAMKFYDLYRHTNLGIIRARNIRIFRCNPNGSQLTIALLYRLCCSFGFRNHKTASTKF